MTTGDSVQANNDQVLPSDASIEVSTKNGTITLPVALGSGGGGGVTSINSQTGAVTVTSSSGTLSVATSSGNVDINSGMSLVGDVIATLNTASVTAAVARIQGVVLNAATPNDGDVLTYVAADTAWENKPPGAGTSKSIMTGFGSFNNGVANGQTKNFSPGSGVAYGTSFDANVPIPLACVVKNLYVEVKANTLDGNTDFTLIVNNSVSALTILVPAATSGVASDLTHTVTLSPGDLVSLLCSTGGTTGDIFFSASLEVDA